MLHERELLLNTLKPPDGYDLDHAVGTTYSLDLRMLLNVPLAFALESWEDGKGKITMNPGDLLTSVRRYADRIDLFCQAGQIKVPGKSQLQLLSFLEGSTFEVNVPHPAGVFHPKVWVLRFRPVAGSKSGPVRYRLLCFTRNLTFDRAWDTSLVLDGELKGGARADSKPVAEFIEALPGLVAGKQTARLKKARKKIREMASEVRRVSFKPPDGFDSCHFHHLGLETRSSWPFPKGADRACIVSPFLSKTLLKYFEDKVAPCNVLVSIPEELGNIDSNFLGRDSMDVYVLNQEADPPETDDDESHIQADSRQLARLRGLHAKLFIVEAGASSWTFTGSANATSAAFGLNSRRFAKNIEFLVELRTTKKKCGIDRLLDGREGSERGLRDYLSEYESSKDDVSAEDPLKEKLDKWRRALSRISLRAVVKTTGGTGKEEYSIDLEADGKRPALPEGVKAVLWPTLLREKTAVGLPKRGGKKLASFENVPFAALSSFFSFKLTARGGREDRFIRKCELEGAPEDRLDRLFEEQFKDGDEVMAYLHVLLAGKDFPVPGTAARTGPGEGNSSASAGSSSEPFPLLELLLRHLVESPETLDEVQQLVENLRKTDDGMKKLPEGMTEVLDSIMAVKKSVR